MKPDIRPETGYEKGRISGTTLIYFSLILKNVATGTGVRLGAADWFV